VILFAGVDWLSSWDCFAAIFISFFADDKINVRAAAATAARDHNINNWVDCSIDTSLA
jgi:hypothetical protein